LAISDLHFVCFGFFILGGGVSETEKITHSINICDIGEDILTFCH